MKKRSFAALLAALMLLSLTACGEKTTAAQASLPGDNPPSAEEVPEQGEYTLEEDLLNQERAEEFAPNQEIDLEWEAQQDAINAYGLDLTMYEDHGEWSSDRMWVEKTESSWDRENVTCYGYIDRNGDLVGQWHEKSYLLYSDKEGLESFANGTMEPATWNQPSDFSGSYATVDCGDCVEVIGLDGNTVARYVFVRAFSPRIFHITDDDSIHVYIPSDDPGNLHLLKIRNGSVTDVAVAVNGGMTLTPSYVQKKNDIFTFHFYDSIIEKQSCFCTFDLDGNVLVQGTTTYEVTDVYPATDGSATAALIFVGADKGSWIVEVDAQGNWLTEPAAY